MSPLSDLNIWQEQIKKADAHDVERGCFEDSLMYGMVRECRHLHLLPIPFDCSSKQIGHMFFHSQRCGAFECSSPGTLSLRFKQEVFRLAPRIAFKRTFKHFRTNGFPFSLTASSISDCLVSIPFDLLRDLMNHAARRLCAPFGFRCCLQVGLTRTSGHGRGGTRSTLATPTSASSSPVVDFPRREFLNNATSYLAGVSGLLSRSSIRLDSQTVNMIWLDLLTGVHGGHLAWRALGCSRTPAPGAILVCLPGVLAILPDSFATSRCHPPSQELHHLHSRPFLRPCCARQGCKKPSVLDVVECFHRAQMFHHRSRRQHQAMSPPPRVWVSRVVSAKQR